MQELKLPDGRNRVVPHGHAWVHKTANILKGRAVGAGQYEEGFPRVLTGSEPRFGRGVDRRVRPEIGAKYDKAAACLTREPRGAGVLRLSRRTLGSPANVEPGRERVCDGSAQDSSHPRIAVIDHG
jgi:hypothetical protein